MDDVQFAAVSIPLGSPEQPNSDLRLIMGLIRADIGEDVIVMTGDGPSFDVLEVDHPKVSCRRSGMRRAKRLQDLGGLSTHDLPGSTRSRFQTSTSISVSMAVILPQSTDTGCRSTNAYGE
ncbi:hypothetical protein [Streptomyces sp. NBC_00435]|uniref:hypothetical protein n=1 Tax=Streptomyces sp. NBC_00435 TaxID=2903649 RepID=UPI002E244BED